ncbi:MAG: class III poly(R)-hydroxyalkanoic acid synthase subunit PhaC [Pseudomonadota bacterium]|jgi:polyhydroxyalkanoate synthase|nr:class III poly(R)-hydroxyalkanoic acid synthase subunit PhaC [Pseudomonadota bacterium]QKK05565.1 MAG: class III poly(R)-hydroxyalkanoic acid synthase subunit PhaC [Pseudomonadota bacterium]
MMSSQFRPEQIADEIIRFNSKLAVGLKNLMDLEEIPTGVTEKEAVYAEDKLILYHFKPHVKAKKVNKTPVLIVYALVNRPYMTDLNEKISFVRGLIESGQEVYLIDWGYPDRADKFTTMDDYINGYIDRCVNTLRRRHKVDNVNILGICQGGAFSLCYASLHPEKVKNLITMVTPVDYHTKENMLSKWIQKVDVDLLVDTLGNIPGDYLNWTFLTLKPYRLMAQKYVDMVNILDNPQYLNNFMRMEKWIYDSPDQAGEAYRQFIKDFYQQNLLIKGKVEIGGKTVDLKNVKMPVLNIFAEDDHLVPPSASKPLGKYVGTKDYTELSFKGGHIGIYVSSAARSLVPPSVGDWLNKRA